MLVKPPAPKPPIIQRTVKVQVDATTFPNGKVPPAIAALQHSPPNLDMLQVLLHLVKLTSPPLWHGFELGGWAAVRYLPALAPLITDLRLRAEWDDQDPHQKTIMSDDFGMAVPTYLLAPALKLRSFAPASFLVGRVHGLVHHTPKNPKRRGQGKCPDFIAFDDAKRVWVIESKGTMASPSALKKLMKDGVQQKRTIKVRPPLKQGGHIVAGLYVPQNKDPRFAPVCRIIDPPLDRDDGDIDDSSGDDLVGACAQADLASALHLMGLHEDGNALASGQNLSGGFSRRWRAEVAQQEVPAELEIAQRTFITRSRSHYYPIPVKATEGEIPGLRLTVGIDAELFGRLSEGRTAEVIRLAADRALSTEWHTSQDARGNARLLLPAGVLLQLEPLASRLG